MKRSFTILTERTDRTEYLNEVESDNIVWAIWGLSTHLERIVEDDDKSAAMSVGCAMHILASVLLDRLGSVEATADTAQGVPS